MCIKNLLEEQLKIALREKKDIRKNALRMALSSIKMAEIDGQKELDDAVIISIIQKEIKTRDETIAEAKKAGREDMILNLEAEKEVLSEFLPKPLTDQELQELVKKIIQDVRAESIKDMGEVMKSAIKEAGGKASNDRISQFVREFLSGE